MFLYWSNGRSEFTLCSSKKLFLRIYSHRWTKFIIFFCFHKLVSHFFHWTSRIKSKTRVALKRLVFHAMHVILSAEKIYRVECNCELHKPYNKPMELILISSKQLSWYSVFVFWCFYTAVDWFICLQLRFCSRAFIEFAAVKPQVLWARTYYRHWTSIHVDG